MVHTMKRTLERSDRLVIRCSPKTKSEFMRVASEMYRLGIKTYEDVLLKLIEVWDARKKVSVVW